MSTTLPVSLHRLLKQNIKFLNSFKSAQAFLNMIAVRTICIAVQLVLQPLLNAGSAVTDGLLMYTRVEFGVLKLRLDFDVQIELH